MPDHESVKPPSPSDGRRVGGRGESRPGGLPDMAAAPGAGPRLFLLSFTALFLELMLIRWVPSEVHLVAYYANLMLVSSFLGLGLGALVSGRNWSLFRWFPVTFAANILLLLVVSGDLLPRGAGEFRFAGTRAGLTPYLGLILVFCSNAATFTPLGEEIGRQFGRLPALRAYSWDLAGSLGGTLAFGLFSLLTFSPVVGLSAVAVIALALAAGRARWWGLPLYGAAVVAVSLAGRADVHWSPYYYITLGEAFLQVERPDHGEAFGRIADRPAAEPPAGLRTMQDPPIYNLRVNQDFYQMHGTVDLRRYTTGGWRHQVIGTAYEQYSLPYALIPAPPRVLVLGAGGGMDVETALLHGAGRVDAVEIDPLIPVLSRRYSSSSPYDDPRVHLHVGDGRAYLQQTTERFDLVAFGYLDSQALFSYGANLRLDGYIHTVESYRRAYACVREGGVMVVWFYAGGTTWLVPKLVQMTRDATGREPLVYLGGGAVGIVSPKGALGRPAPERIGTWAALHVPAIITADVATDDWPFLYLQRRGVPPDYVTVIAVLLGLSALAVVWLRGARFGSGDAHFLFMGWGFLLLQTKSIGDCSLYFGTTWLVTMLVISGVLLMVLLANWVALRFLPRFQPWMFGPLFVSLVLLLLMPRDTILAQSLGGRLAWTLFAVPLPVFFAGLIFSTTFRAAASAPALFGANLIGATFGGFSEYLGMAIGQQRLGFLVIAAYAASLLSLLWRRRGGGPAAPV